MRFSGRRLRDLRQSAGLTHTQLAAAANVSAGTIFNWESGRYQPTLVGAAEVARTLGVEIETFLEDDDTNPTP